MPRSWDVSRAWNLNQTPALSHSQVVELQAMLQDFLFLCPLELQRERYEFLYATFSNGDGIASYCTPNAYFGEYPLRYSAIQYVIDCCPQVFNGSRLRTLLNALGVTASLASSRSREITQNHINQWERKHDFIYHKKLPSSQSFRALGFPYIRSVSFL